MSEDWIISWKRFQEAAKARQERCYQELAGACNDVTEIHRMLCNVIEQRGHDAGVGGSIHELMLHSRENLNLLIEKPVEQYLQRMPIRRALSALEEYESSMKDLVRYLPESLPISGMEFAEGAGFSRPTSWRRTLLGKVRFRHGLSVQRILSDFLWKESLGRQGLDGLLQLLLAQICLMTRDPWLAYRTQSLRRYEGQTVQWDLLAKAWEDWERQSETLVHQLTGVLEQYRRRLDGFRDRLEIVFQRGGGVAGFINFWISRLSRFFWDRNTAYWLQQQRAVYSVLELDLRLSRLGVAALQITALRVEAVHLEHEQIRQSAEAFSQWLDAWSPRTTYLEPSFPETRLLTLEEHVSQWVTKLSAIARQLLPEKVETLNPKYRLAPVQISRRMSHPQKTNLLAIELKGKPIYQEAVRGVVELNLSVAREMEHARQVMAYALDNARSAGAQSDEILAEAKRNAQTLLSVPSGTDLEIGRSLTQLAVRAIVSIANATNSNLEIKRLGLLGYLMKLRDRRAFAELKRLSAQVFRTVGRNLGGWLEKGVDVFLLRIGWRLPTRPLAEPVMERPTLTQVLEVKLMSRELPFIYRKLFSLAPVEEARFLVGRQEELAGFERALAQWEAGHFAAILLVGTRGSGKTSLLNCAATKVFHEQNFIRGHLEKRITAVGDIQQFLLKMLSAPGDSELIDVLNRGRRVVVIEEFERAFLRKVNGFEAIRYLLSQIQPTSASTLWIFSLNDDAFRYLDVAADLGRFFSHRINAMSVKPEDLTNAIMQRHNLSGLRLKYSPPPPEDPRVSKIRRVFGMERDPEKMFMDALYEQSGGNFRSAFELWQGCIDQVEGGVVEMRHPLVPNYSRLQRAMDTGDHFILMAIMQHGSLTDAELSEVLCEPPSKVRLRMDRLHAMEVVEADPQSPGGRIRPEASRFVAESLARVNLL